MPAPADNTLLYCRPIVVHMRRGRRCDFRKYCVAARIYAETLVTLPLARMQWSTADEWSGTGILECFHSDCVVRGRVCAQSE